MTTSTTLPPAGLFRRLAALIYDTLIIIAIEMMAAGIVMAVVFALNAAGLLSYGEYADAADMLGKHPVLSPLFTLYLAGVWIYFFVFFWTRAGQTLGMRAWKLRVRNTKDGAPITVTQALIRISTSGFGLANLTVPIDPKKRGFHDIWAKTEVVVLPKAN
ncbi:RDD family protein [Vibrio sp. B511a]|uniref:RDD family protein n=1 Tax=Vibrio alginolyticus TaxID=663 RepID=A0A7Y4B5G3_VIBAL|nr:MULTISPECIES: RDD family protein [Vibrio]EGQ8018765.1 RDD family protein [Vibrio alginolyticus]KAB2116452.1 RDD family protein [Vibrio alginolyticus]MCQ9104236.1 RDD family protein [Vibrio alginolyticus]MDK9734478.1 RDD family protein [Vibrio sp. B511a]NOI11047.1 RDD family protein [Vibrio alginolyticus]